MGIKILTTLAFALFGLLTGSFINVCIYRIPRGTFFKDNRSFCPQCRYNIKWYDNIPVFSWLILKGRCRNCKEKISVRYPIIELLNMILWLFVGYKFGLSVQSIIFGIVFSILLIISMIDIDIQEVSNKMLLIILVIAIIYIFFSDLKWYEHLIGAFAVSLHLLIVGIITQGIGGGDIKLLFVTGLLLGYKAIIVAGLLGIIVGAIIGLILIVLNKSNKKTMMPLVPALTVGIVVASLYGQDLFNLYFNIFN